MRKRWVTVVSFGVAGLLAASHAEATPREIRDGQGRVALVVEDDGTTVSYAYDEQGNRIATQRTDGSRTEVNPSAVDPPAPASSQPGAPN